MLLLDLSSLLYSFLYFMTALVLLLCTIILLCKSSSYLHLLTLVLYSLQCCTRRRTRIGLVLKLVLLGYSFLNLSPHVIIAVTTSAYSHVLRLAHVSQSSSGTCQ